MEQRFTIGTVLAKCFGEHNLTNNCLEIITPRDWKQRGCQVSVVAHGYGRDLFNKLMANGVMPEWREPNVIRMAPVPLYNSFEDVYRFGVKLEEALG